MSNEIRNFLASDDVIVDLDATCKRGVLRRLSDHIQARMGIPAPTLLEALIEREQLGSTAVGNGIALPHARTNVPQLHGVFARLRQPVDFEAVDDGPVDIVFLLLAPEAATAEHLKALSRIARSFRSPATLQALRGADGKSAIYDILTGQADAEAA